MIDSVIDSVMDSGKRLREVCCCEGTVLHNCDLAFFVVFRGRMGGRKVFVRGRSEVGGCNTMFDE